MEVLPAEAGRVPLGKVLDMLGEEGILTLLTETGTRLNTALLAAGLVDRVHLFVVAADHGLGRGAGVSRHGTLCDSMAAVEVERYGNDLGVVLTAAGSVAGEAVIRGRGQGSGLRYR